MPRSALRLRCSGGNRPNKREKTTSEFRFRLSHLSQDGCSALVESVTSRFRTRLGVIQGGDFYVPRTAVAPTGAIVPVPHRRIYKNGQSKTRADEDNPTALKMLAWLLLHHSQQVQSERAKTLRLPKGKVCQRLCDKKHTSAPLPMLLMPDPVIGVCAPSHHPDVVKDIRP